MSNHLVHYTGYIPSQYTSDASLVEYQIDQLSQNATVTGINYIFNGILLYNLGKGLTQSEPFPIYIPPPSAPSEKLIPGIICDGIQILGIGQPDAVRLHDSSNDTLTDLQVRDLKGQVTIEIDSEKNIYISCVSDCSYQGKHIWSMIFNIFDASGWLLEAEKDVSLNLTNTLGLNNSTSYDISLAGISSPILILREYSSFDSSLIEISNNYIGNTSNTDLSYSIYIENGNEIYIKSKNNTVYYNNYYVDSLKFNLHDLSNNFLGPSNVFLYIAPATLYDICYNSTYATSFKINTISNELAWNENNYLIKLDSSGTLIGKLYPLGYTIHPYLEYYNINNLTYNKNNLIELTNTPVLLGKINL